MSIPEVSRPDARGRYMRVLTHGKMLSVIEDEILRCVKEGARVLMSTADDGPSGIVSGEDSRNAAIAEWAERLAWENRLDWRRVGRDVLFAAVR